MRDECFTPVDVPAPIRIYGQIIGPMKNPEAYTTIILKAISTNWQIIQDTTATTQTDQNGNYDFEVYPGKYAVFFERRGIKQRVNDIVVYSDSEPGPLQKFMLTPTAADLTPLLVRQTIAAAELVDGKAIATIAAAASAKKSAEESSDNADAAGVSAESASTDASSASQSAISAGDSASSAASDEALAHQWADNPEDVPVQDGEFSAFHWAQKAKGAVSGGAVISITAGETELTPDSAGNIPLGSAATATLTTSTIDNTPGRVLKVGDSGLSYQTYGVMPDNTPANSRSAMGLGFSRLFGSEDTPSDFAHYNLIMMPETLGGVYSVLALSDNGTPSYRGFGTNSTDPITWVKLYDELNKPTAADTGALPASGGKVTGPLEIESSSPTLQLTETDTGKKYFIVVDNGNIRLNQDTLAGVNGILSFDATTKDWTLPGGVIPEKYDNFFALFQKINTASLNTNGRFEDTNTGFIIQYGIGGGQGEPTNYPIQFPEAFPSKCFAVFTTLQSGSWDEASGSNLAQIIDNTQAYVWSTHSFFWFAIGI